MPITIEFLLCFLIDHLRYFLQKNSTPLRVLLSDDKPRRGHLLIVGCDKIVPAMPIQPDAHNLIN